MSRYIAKVMYLEMTKCLIIWKWGSTYVNQLKLVSYCITILILSFERMDTQFARVIHPQQRHFYSFVGQTKNKTRYTPYVSPESQISHIATNKGNIKWQCLIYNVLIIKDITLGSKQRKDNSGLKVKTPLHRDNWLVDHKPNCSNLW
jgi:hypothetical protein